MAQAKANKGRRVVCTQSLANEICDGLAAGKTLTALCRAKHLPAAATVLKWVKDSVLIEYDGTEDQENLTGIDKALLEHRDHLAATISAAGNKPDSTVRSAPAQGDNAQGEKANKVDGGGVASSLLFRDHYVLARVIGYEMLGDQIRDIADDDSRDMVDGKANHAATQRDRLRADVYRWTLARMLPKVYSEQGVKLTVQGGDGSNAPDVILTGNDVDL